MARRLRGQKQIGPLKNIRGFTYSPQEQTEILASHFEKQFTNNNSSKLTENELLNEADNLIRENINSRPPNKVKPNFSYKENQKP